MMRTIENGVQQMSRGQLTIHSQSDFAKFQRWRNKFAQSYAIVVILNNYNALYFHKLSKKFAFYVYDLGANSLKKFCNIS